MVDLHSIPCKRAAAVSINGRQATQMQGAQKHLERQAHRQSDPVDDIIARIVRAVHVISLINISVFVVI
jgi:hypothetical protein